MKTSKDLMKIFDWDNPVPNRVEQPALPGAKPEEDYDTELSKILELAGVRSGPQAYDLNGNPISEPISPSDPLHQPLPNAEYRGRFGGPTMADRVQPKNWPNMITGEMSKK